MHDGRVSGMIIGMRHLLCMLAIAMISAPVHAVVPPEPTWYAVELVVFAHREDATEDEERWSPDPGVPDLSTATEPVAATIPDSLRAFEQLRTEALTMSGAVRTLERSSRYRTLVHFGWMQPGLAREHAIPLTVTIDSGDPLVAQALEVELPEPPADETPVEASPDGAQAPDADSEGMLETEPVPEFPRDPSELADELAFEFTAPPTPDPLVGTARLVLQRFLHIELDLMLESGQALPPTDEGDWYTRRDRILEDLAYGAIGYDEARARLDALNAEPRFQRYRLRESRRVRTDELHYFDHPKFGAIVRVVEVPEDEIEVRRQAYEDAFERALLEQAGAQGSGQPR